MWRKTALALTALTALTACTTNDNAERELKAAAPHHMDAVNEGDIPGLRQHMSNRCVAAKTNAELEEIVVLIHTMYGEITLTDVKVTDMDEDHTQARVQGTTGIHALDSGPGSWWVYENGTWRADDC